MTTATDTVKTQDGYFVGGRFEPTTSGRSIEIVSLRFKNPPRLP